MRSIPVRRAHGTFPWKYPNDPRGEPDARIGCRRKQQCTRVVRALVFAEKRFLARDSSRRSLGVTPGDWQRERQKLRRRYTTLPLQDSPLSRVHRQTMGRPSRRETASNPRRTRSAAATPGANTCAHNTDHRRSGGGEHPSVHSSDVASSRVILRRRPTNRSTRRRKGERGGPLSGRGGGNRPGRQIRGPPRRRPRADHRPRARKTSSLRSRLGHGRVAHNTGARGGPKTKGRTKWATGEVEQRQRARALSTRAQCAREEALFNY